MSPSRAIVAPLAAAILLEAGTASTASALSAVSPAPPLRCQSRGPCQLPDSFDVSFRAAAPPFAAASPILSVNFGLLYPAAGAPGFEYACEESFGGRAPDRVPIDATGRAFVVSGEGVYRSDDGCAWTRAITPVAALPALDVAIDPSAPGRVWALGGDLPRALALSVDGGVTFAIKRTFTDGSRFYRLAVAPSDPRVIYVAGYNERGPLVIAWSEDGGDTWTLDDPAGGFADAPPTVEFLGVAPDRAQTVYLAVARSSGDQIWKSTDHGRAATMVLALAGTEQKWGFAFGATGETLYVAGRDLLEKVGKAPARLYTSHDGGRTWDEPVPSGADGPRYRCLAQHDGKLYACAGGEPAGDAFLLGVSSDEGKHWSPVIRLGDVVGPKTCGGAPCAATDQWLCASYGICGADGGGPGRREARIEPSGDGGEARDGNGAGDASSASAPGGCGCALGGGRGARIGRRWRGTGRQRRR